MGGVMDADVSSRGLDQWETLVSQRDAANDLAARRKAERDDLEARLDVAVKRAEKLAYLLDVVMHVDESQEALVDRGDR